MEIPEKFRVLRKRALTLLFPMGDLVGHLRNVSRQTSEELGLRPEIIQKLETFIEETAHEGGLSV